MRKTVILLLLLIAPIMAQKAKDQENLKTTEARYSFGKYVLVIRHQDRTNLPTQEQLDAGIKPIWRSSFLEIWEKRKIINHLDFDDIWPLGWKAGIFLPMKQEAPRHFILTKYGDYDGRTIIITDKGKLFNLGGGKFRIFRNRYLVTPRALTDVDVKGEFSVFDLQRDMVLMTPTWRDLTKDTLQRSPSPGMTNSVEFFTYGPEFFVGVGMVEESWQVPGHIHFFFKLDLETGKLEDAEFDIKKHKQFVTDYSNIDLKHLAVEQHSLKSMPK